MHSNWENYISGAWLHDPEFNLPVWFQRHITFKLGHFHGYKGGEEMSYALALGVEATLSDKFPYLDGTEPENTTILWFHCIQASDEVVIEDHYLNILAVVPNAALQNAYHDVCNAYAWADDLREALRVLFDQTIREAHFKMIKLRTMGISLRNDPLPAVQCNCVIPELPTIVIDVNGHPAHALLDTGSMADFIFAWLVHQLGLKSFELAKPLPVHLAVQGSRSKIHSRLALGFNPTTVEIGSTKLLPVEGKQSKVLESQATETVCEYLPQDSPLLPLHAIDHVYTW
ncbi:uncharacterized protein LAESUDRAFT_739589 [Laetiporus sulphureus 93-53]|uniref:Uncharacterized protein n=1 Tax=Laetiporus sulphureus 93-53 TaxID=1314785 RepID=A0A165B8I1_9APHY|nr:uncharacterized protein LAESUDRAFT_739589 [Laetiporus sulphureus 93-53]KZT00488.1 hypothetical protein LAESUDRAFT_739589 [Laetiporus sulphureus 93-53]